MKVGRWTGFSFLLLLLVGGLWFSWPVPGQGPLEVGGLQAVEEIGDRLRITLNGRGFDPQTQVSLLPDIGNQYMVNGLTPLSGMVNGMARSGDLLLLADSPDGLILCDVSRPDRPRVLASLPLPGIEWSVAVHGNLALLVSVEAGLQLIDISRPDAPQLLGSLSLPGIGRGLVCSGDRVYIAGMTQGLLIVDIAEPHSPRLIGSVNLPGKAWAVADMGGRLLVAAGRPGVLVLDPANGEPVLEGRFEVPGRVRQVLPWQEGLLARTDKEVYWIDPDRDRPTRLLVKSDGRHLGFMAVHRQLLMLGTSRGLQLVQLDRAGRQVRRGFIATLGSVRAVMVVDDWLFFGDARAGLKRLLLPELERIPSADFLSLPTRTSSFMLREGKLWTANNAHGLEVFSSSEAPKPPSLGRLYEDLNGRSMARGPERFYVGTEHRELLSVERINDGLVIRNRQVLPGLPNRLLVIDRLLLVADAHAGVLVYSLADPDRPQLLGGLPARGVAVDVDRIGDRILVCEGQGELRLARLASDGSLHEEQRLRLPGSLSKVTVSGRHVLGVNNRGEATLLGLDEGGRLRLFSQQPNLPRVYDLAPGNGCFYADLDGLGLVVLVPAGSDGDRMLIHQIQSLEGERGEIARDGETLWCVDGAGIKRFSLASPHNPALTGILPMRDNLATLLPDGDTLLGLTSLGNLVLMSMDRPEQAPTLLGAAGQSFDLEGGLGLLLTRDQLQLIELDPSGGMRLISAVRLPAVGHKVVSRNGYAYVTCGEAGLVTIDISQPHRPVLEAELALEGTSRGLALTRDFALVAAGQGGLSVVDIRNPRQPELVQRLSLAPPLGQLSNFYDIIFDGHYAYIADMENGLVVVRVNADGSARVVSHVQTAGHARQLDLSGKDLYLADLDGGVVAMDVSRPEWPRLVGIISVPGLAKQVSVAGDQLWLLSGGFTIYRMARPVEASDLHLEIGGTLTAELPRPATGGYYTLRVAGPNGASEINGAVHLESVSPSH